jgi:hypothetical protein
LTTALQFIKPKNLTPWRDSNPGASVLEANAMTTMPGRQGKVCIFEEKILKKLFNFKKIIIF